MNIQVRSRTFSSFRASMAAGRRRISASIADVADKYKVPMVKITGSQRIDLLGIKKADLPRADLGMPSGQAHKVSAW